jgi:hypothetical protein
VFAEFKIFDTEGTEERRRNSEKERDVNRGDAEDAEKTEEHSQKWLCHENRRRVR